MRLNSRTGAFTLCPFIAFYLLLFVSAWRLMRRVRCLLREDCRFCCSSPCCPLSIGRAPLLAFRAAAARAGIVKERVGRNELGNKARRSRRWQQQRRRRRPKGARQPNSPFGAFLRWAVGAASCVWPRRLPLWLCKQEPSFARGNKVLRFRRAFCRRRGKSARTRLRNLPSGCLAAGSQYGTPTPLPPGMYAQSAFGGELGVALRRAI